MRSISRMMKTFRAPSMKAADPLQSSRGKGPQEISSKCAAGLRKAVKFLEGHLQHADGIFTNAGSIEEVSAIVELIQNNTLSEAYLSSVSSLHSIAMAVKEILASCAPLIPTGLYDHFTSPLADFPKLLDKLPVTGGQLLEAVLRLLWHLVHHLGSADSKLSAEALSQQLAKSIGIFVLRAERTELYGATSSAAAHLRAFTSLIEHFAPAPASSAANGGAEAAAAESIQDRSVKVTFLNPSAVPAQAQLRGALSRFGDIVNIGYKGDKLAVVLFAKGTEAVAAADGWVPDEGSRIRYLGDRESVLLRAMQARPALPTTSSVEHAVVQVVTGPAVSTPEEVHSEQGSSATEEVQDDEVEEVVPAQHTPEEVQLEDISDIPQVSLSRIRDEVEEGSASSRSSSGGQQVAAAAPPGRWEDQQPVRGQQRVVRQIHVHSVSRDEQEEEEDAMDKQKHAAIHSADGHGHAEGEEGEEEVFLEERRSPPKHSGHHNHQLSPTAAHAHSSPRDLSSRSSSMRGHYHSSSSSSDSEEEVEKEEKRKGKMKSPAAASPAVNGSNTSRDNAWKNQGISSSGSATAPAPAPAAVAVAVAKESKGKEEKEEQEARRPSLVHFPALPVLEQESPASAPVPITASSAASVAAPAMVSNSSHTHALGLADGLGPDPNYGQAYGHGYGYGYGHPLSSPQHHLHEHTASAAALHIQQQQQQHAQHHHNQQQMADLLERIQVLEAHNAQLAEQAALQAEAQRRQQLLWQADLINLQMKAALAQQASATLASDLQAARMDLAHRIAQVASLEAMQASLTATAEGAHRRAQREARSTVLAQQKLITTLEVHLRDLQQQLAAARGEQLGLQTAYDEEVVRCLHYKTLALQHPAGGEEQQSEEVQRLRQITSDEVAQYLGQHPYTSSAPPRPPLIAPPEANEEVREEVFPMVSPALSSPSGAMGAIEEDRVPERTSSTTSSSHARQRRSSDILSEVEQGRASRSASLARSITPSGAQEQQQPVDVAAMRRYFASVTANHTHTHALTHSNSPGHSHGHGHGSGMLRSSSFSSSSAQGPSRQELGQQGQGQGQGQWYSHRYS